LHSIRLGFVIIVGKSLSKFNAYLQKYPTANPAMLTWRQAGKKNLKERESEKRRIFLRKNS